MKVSLDLSAGEEIISLLAASYNDVIKNAGAYIEGARTLVQVLFEKFARTYKKFW